MIRVSVLLLSLVLGLQSYAASPSISGEVNLEKGLTLPAGGALFIIAKEGGKPMPVAVVRVVEPKFPHKFSISGDNAMMAGAPFNGPFTITARFSPSGDAMDKSGPEAAAPGSIKVGTANLKLELKPKK